MSKRLVYMDNNATTPLHPEVKKVMTEAMEVFGNPSSLHSFGRHARHLVEEARTKTASFIGADPDEIIFTGSGSEANNTVLSILTCPASKCECHLTRRSGLVTTKIEHPCILEASKCLEEKGFGVTYLDADCLGKLYMDQVRNKVTDKTAMVSVMMANNEIGTTQDVGEICAITHEKGALFHTDAVQAVGKMPVDVKKLDVDFLTLSAHKIYGPKGIGVLYVKRGTPYCPMIRGGHQERGRRAGTENTIGIIGLGKAIEMRAKEMAEEEERLKELKKVLRKGIEENVPDISFNGHPIDCLPGTLNVSFDGAEGESVLLYLDLEGIAVSTGSACASGSLDPSHVLMATGIPVERAHGSIRISLGRSNTMDDVKYFINVIPRVINKIREMSTAQKGVK